MAGERASHPRLTMDDAIGTLELSAEEECEMREAGELYFLCYHSSYAEIDDTLLASTNLANTFARRLRERVKKNGERVIVDPAMTTARIYMWCRFRVRVNWNNTNIPV